VQSRKRQQRIANRAAALKPVAELESDQHGTWQQ
jgi:hypothetical protein